MQKHFLQDLIEPIVEKQGYELIRILTMGGQTNPTLQVMIDKNDETDITIDDCAKVSRALSDVLDNVDPIEGQYALEVSSPGLDRPLTKLSHFERFTGYDVKVETEDKINNRKRFKGKIKEINGEEVVLIDTDETYVIPFSVISKAKLIVTDELWEKYQATHVADEL